VFLTKHQSVSFNLNIKVHEIVTYKYTYVFLRSICSFSYCSLVRIQCININILKELESIIRNIYLRIFDRPIGFVRRPSNENKLRNLSKRSKNFLEIFHENQQSNNNSMKILDFIFEYIRSNRTTTSLQLSRRRVHTFVSHSQLLQFY